MNLKIAPHHSKDKSAFNDAQFSRISFTLSSAVSIIEITTNRDDLRLSQKSDSLGLMCSLLIDLIHCKVIHQRLLIKKNKLNDQLWELW